MADFRFIHCADLHLGGRGRGIRRGGDGINKRMSEAAMESFARIVDRAVAEDADLMVIAGDVFDGTNETPATRHAFAEQLGRFDAPVFVCTGNHDRRTAWSDTIPYPGNVHVFGRDPQSLVVGLRGGSVEVIGRSFPDDGGSFDPLEGIRGREGMFSIAVLHCTVDAAGADPDYGPCRLADMRNRGVDYWAIGHIHKRTVVSEDPYVVYPGSIQGRNRKETGPKGAYLVSVTGDRVTGLEFFPTQSILWEDVVCDIAGLDMEGLIAALERLIGRGTMVNLTLTGAGPLDAPLRLGGDGFIHTVERRTGAVVADLSLRTHPLRDREAAAGGRDLRAHLIVASDRTASSDRQALIDTICSTRQSAEIRHVFEALDDDRLRELVRDAEAYVIDKLTEASG